MPPSIMARWASTEVNRSSSSVTGTSGKAARNLGMKASTWDFASDGLPSRFTGYPITMRTILSFSAYFLR